MGEHEVFLFLAQVVVLVAAARIGGELALRAGLPQVVGELALGICLGPSLFGQLWPGGFRALFPADPDQRALLDVVGWIGVLFIVMVAGLHTATGLSGRSAKAVVAGSVGGFFVPYACGYAFALAVPSDLIPRDADERAFALFLATALSISAIPVIARILGDLHLSHTVVGVTIMTTAIADDTLGWILLAIPAGIASEGSVHFGPLARQVAGTAVFLVGSFTVGLPLVRWVLRQSGEWRSAHAQASLILLLVFAGGMTTQAIGVHFVLGAFVAGILIGRSGGIAPPAVDAIQQVGFGFFAPFFFAYTGIKADLTALDGSTTLIVAAAAVLVASLSKLVGGSLGARFGGLPKWDALAVGAGLNARGAMELVIASVGLSLGLLTNAFYAILVLIAVVTTLMAGPMIRFCVARASTKHGGDDLSLPPRMPRP